MKVEIECDRCKKKIFRYPSQIKSHNFCSKLCLAEYSNKEKNPDGYANLKDYSGQSENMRRINQKLNPSRMTPVVRKKLRELHLNSGEGRHYAKLYSRLEHRVVAERILGRPLKKEEVVHHLDFNKRNNNPDNLMIFPNNYAHMKYHAKLKKFLNRGVIDEWVVEEVLPDGIQTT